MEFSERVTRLEPEGAYFMLARAQMLEAQGKQIIHLEIGQPNFDTFENIKAAGIRAIQDGFTRYTPSAGIPKLREIIAEKASAQRNVTFTTSQVVVGPGAKPALFFPTLALVKPGDEVIYPDPGFPTYEAMIRVAGGVPIPVGLAEKEGFSFDLDEFDRKVNSRTRLVILNSPGNPTGGVMPQAALEHIAEAATKFDFWVLSDEIYSRLNYSNLPIPSIASIPGMLGRTIICDGFSKTYAMTGWRLGFGIMPEKLAERVELLLTHSIGCTASFTQWAGIEALLGDQEQVKKSVKEYQRRRDLMIAGLNSIPGISCQTPQGAFYAFPNVSALGKPSQWIADYLLDQAGVAVLPGTSFGKRGEGFLRLCFANSLENIQGAMERIQKAISLL